MALGGPGGITAIERFSLLSGGRLGAVARVPPIKETSEGYVVSNPHLMPGGGYMLTIAHDVDCRQAPSSECIPIADSCASRIETLAPGSKRLQLLFTEPRSRYVWDALPSPDGQRAALFETGCPGGGIRIMIRNLRTGAERMVVGNAQLCVGSSLSWSPDGSRIAFPYAVRRSGRVSAGGCSLAIASSRHYSPASSWRLIAPDDGCGFSSVAFDAQGLAGVEQCGPVGTTPTTKVVQFNSRLHRIASRSLPHGTPGMSNEQTGIANDPTGHIVLVSQSEEGANVVSAFNGHKLRVIGRYKNPVFAEP